LVSLGQDVDIVVKPHVASLKEPATLRVAWDCCCSQADHASKK
jgi:hypothetical protein